MITAENLILQKIENKKLSKNEFCTIIAAIEKKKLSDIHIAAFLTACACHSLDITEIIHLTECMSNVGSKLVWPYEKVFDKHCVGGLPGNRTTPIVVSIVSAYGLNIPKTSSRSITSPAGTADTLSVITNVDLKLDEIKKVVEKYHGCFVWGGGEAFLSPVDDLLIKVEHALNLDAESQVIASILSKKISAGSNHIVIDIPIGPEIKVKNQAQANNMKYKFEVVGKYLGLNIKTIYTDGTQPVGNGVGPVCEAIDVMDVLKCDVCGPHDLRERSLKIAGAILDFEMPEGEGYKIAKNILDSGHAWHHFKNICRMQGAFKKIVMAKFHKTYHATFDGMIKGISNAEVSELAKKLGAPHWLTAGLRLHKKVGHEFKKGDPLLTLYTEQEDVLEICHMCAGDIYHFEMN